MKLAVAISLFLLSAQASLVSSSNASCPTTTSPIDVFKIANPPSALQNALNSKNAQDMHLILEAYPRMKFADQDRSKALLVAIQENAVEFFSYLFDNQHVQLAQYAGFCLKEAAKVGNTEIMTLVLQKTGYSESREPVKAAIENNQIECLDLLLHDPRFKYIQDSFDMAAANPNPVVLKHLLENYPFNASGQNLKDLINVCIKTNLPKNAKLASPLVKKKYCELNYVLSYAFNQKSWEIVQLLLSNKWIPLGDVFHQALPEFMIGLLEVFIVSVTTPDGIDKLARYDLTRLTPLQLDILIARAAEEPEMKEHLNGFKLDVAKAPVNLKDDEWFSGVIQKLNADQWTVAQLSEIYVKINAIVQSKAYRQAPLPDEILIKIATESMEEN